MSKPRYDWWSYVKGMIRRYPVLAAEVADMKQTIVTAQISDMPHSTGTSDPTANAAMRQLSPINQREYDAVSSAIEYTRLLPDGVQRLKVIGLVLWGKSHTLAGAAIEVNVSEATVWRWHGEFIRLVASYFGLMDAC